MQVKAIHTLQDQPLSLGPRPYDIGLWMVAMRRLLLQYVERVSDFVGLLRHTAH